MPNTRGIPGNPGSLPPGGPPADGGGPGRPVADPTPDARTGRLVTQGGKLFVVTGNMRIPVEDPQGLLNSRGTTTPRGEPPRSTRQPLPVADDLRQAVEAVARHRDELLAIRGVAGVRAGYRFENGAITKTPAIVVAVLDVHDRAGFDKAGTARKLGIPAVVDGVP